MASEEFLGHAFESKGLKLKNGRSNLHTCYQIFSPLLLIFIAIILVNQILRKRLSTSLTSLTSFVQPMLLWVHRNSKEGWQMDH